MANDIYERIYAARQGGATSPASSATPSTTASTTNSDIYGRIANARSGESIPTPVPTPTTSTKKEEEEKENLWDKIKKLAGYTAESAASGAVEAVEGNVNAVSDWYQRAQKSAMQNAAGGAAMAAAFSNNELVDQMAAKRQEEAKEAATTPTKIVANFGDKYAQKVAEKYDTENMGIGGKLLGDVASGFGQYGVDALASLALPGVGGVLSSFGSAYGNSIQEAKNNGADDLEAMAYGFGVGAVEAATEKLLGGMSLGKEFSVYGKGLLDKVGKPLIEKLSKNTATKIALNTVRSGLGEGFEEFVSEFGTRLVDKLTINQDTRNFIETLGDAGYSALVGGIIGAIANTGDSIRAGKEASPATLAEEAANKAAETINAEAKILPSTPTETQQANVTPEAADPKQGASGEANISNEGVDESTSVNDNPAEHTEAEQIVIEQYKNSVDSNLAEFYDKALMGEKLPPFEFGVVSDAAANKIAEIAGKDVSGFALVIEPRIANHINKRHGVNGKHDHSMSDTNDVARMKYVIDNFDNAEDGGNTDAYWEVDEKGKSRRAKTVNFSKKINGTYYVVEAVPVTKARKAYIVSAYMTKNGKKNAGDKRLTDAISPPVYTAKTDNAFSSANNNLSQPSLNVNNVSNAESGIYDVSTGAAKTKQGPLVKTESKATTKSINLGEESRKAVAPAPHEQISEKLSLARAGANIMVDGNGNIVDFEGTVDDLLNKEKWSGVDEDTAQLLLDEAEKRNDAQTIKRLAERIQTTNTEAAQLLQSTQKWIEKSPGGRLAAMYQLVAKYAKDHKAKKGKTLEIPDELAQKYLAAQTETERDAVIGEIQQHIADSTKSTFLDWWTALRYVNMLGNFKTLGRNVGGNLVNKITYTIKDDIAAIIESLSKSDRTKSVAVGREWMQAAKADYKNAEKRIFALGKYTGENFKGEFIEGIEKGRTILPPGFEQYRKATNWAMEQGDAMFAKSAYARALAGFLKANGVKAEQLEGGTVSPELMEKAREYAVKQAQEQTFRDSNAFSDWASRALRREDTPKAIKVIGEGIAPFRRTPANIMVRAAEFSPIGLVKTAVDAVKAKKGKVDMTASDIIEELSKELTGTALIVLGAVLGKAGLLRGSGNDEEEDIDALMNRQDWSIVIPGVGSYTIDWAAPTTLPLFVGAQLMDALDGEGLTMRESEEIFMAMTEPIVAMSMLNGIEDTLNGVKYSDNNMWQLVASSAMSYLTQGLTNTLLGQIERTFEPVRMSTYADKMKDLPDWLQRGLGKASAKFPGLDYNQTEYLNEFGETESNGSVGARIFENLFSPGYFEASKEGEKAYDFVQELYDRFGIDATPNAYAESSIEVNGINYQLTQEQKNQYQEVRGQTIKEFYEALEGNKAFGKLDGERAGDIISTLMSYANKKAKYEVATDMGLDMERTAKEEVFDDMTPSQYIEYLVLGERTPVAANYKDKPQWQQYEQAIKTLPDSLAIDMIYASSEVNGKRFEAAVNAGVSIEDVLAYYTALTKKTPDGKEPSAGEKQRRIRELGLDFGILRELDKAWDITLED